MAAPSRSSRWSWGTRTSALLLLLGGLPACEAACPDAASLCASFDVSQATPQDPPALFPIGQDGVQTWHLDTRVGRRLMQLRQHGAARRISGALINEAGAAGTIDSIGFTSGGVLTLRARFASYDEWHRLTLREGVLTGRFATTASAAAAPPPRDYRSHVSGWHAEVFNRDLVPRVFDLTLGDADGDTYRATLRIDRGHRPPPAQREPAAVQRCAGRG